MLFKRAASIFVAKPVRMDIPLARVVDIQVVDAIHNLKKAGLNQNRVTLSGSIKVI
ncbi:hypothetical protein AM1_6301 [Acaryochloris marina MBIC11017]|uniref:Uncharacterized protein n=1 Tax=Acaryochloris marina (strain MBIC 11017) TaxID=329726 RepID=B0C7E7_ACAM1|nr:hypothetical protein AM1_6301 [Acaryochloris marina MBIC11017]